MDEKENTSKTTVTDDSKEPSNQSEQNRDKSVTVEDFVKDLSDEDKKMLVEKIKIQEKLYEDFLAFDWGHDEKWKLFLINLYPPPKTQEKVMFFRKKFYHFQINSDFDYKFPHHELYIGQYVGKESKKPENNPEKNTEKSNKSFDKNNTAYAYSATSGKISIFENLFASLTAMIWTLFYFNFFSPVLTTVVSSLASLMSILLYLGFPKFTFEYREELMFNEYFHILLYSLLVLNTDKLNHVLLFPIALQATLFIAHYCKKYLRIFRFIMKAMNKVLLNETKILKLKAYALIIIGFLLFLGLLLQVNDYFIIFAQWLYLWFMYRHNIETKEIFHNMNTAILKVKNNSSTPFFMVKSLDYLLRICSKINSMLQL